MISNSGVNEGSHILKFPAFPKNTRCMVLISDSKFWSSRTPRELELRTAGLDVFKYESYIKFQHLQTSEGTCKVAEL